VARILKFSLAVTIFAVVSLPAAAQRGGGSHGGGGGSHSSGGGHSSGSGGSHSSGSSGRASSGGGSSRGSSSFSSGRPASAPSSGVVVHRGSGGAGSASPSSSAQTSANWMPTHSAVSSTPMAAVVAAARANRLRVTAGINSRTEFRRGIGFRFHEFRRFHRFPVFGGFFGSPFCGPFFGGGFFGQNFLFADEFNCFGGGFFGPSAFFYSNYSTWQGSSFDVSGQQAATDSGDGELPPMFADLVAGGATGTGPGWIGVSCAPLDGAPGLKVNAVLLEGPAALAGLRAGDVITELEGTPVESVQAFEAEIARRAPGSQIHIHFVHLGWEIEATITVGESPKSSVR
jgi:hypothetical protein